MRMSKSKAKDFLQCPRKFKYNYIDNLRTKEEPEEGSPLKIGLDVHEIFEWYYKQPEAKKITKPYDQSMWNIFVKHPMAAEYVDFIDNFIQFNVETLIPENGVPGYVPPEVELYIHDKELNLNGIIDAVFDSEDGKVVVDYKTGKPRAITEYILELTLYKMLYERHTGKKVAHCGIYFPKTNTMRMARCLEPGEECDNKGPCISLEDEFVALDTLDTIREKIEEEDFPAKPGFLCRYCDYVNLCTADGVDVD